MVQSAKGGTVQITTLLYPNPLCIRIDSKDSVDTLCAKLRDHTSTLPGHQTLFLLGGGAVEAGKKRQLLEDDPNLIQIKVSDSESVTISLKLHPTSRVAGIDTIDSRRLYQCLFRTAGVLF